MEVRTIEKFIQLEAELLSKVVKETHWTKQREHYKAAFGLLSMIICDLKKEKELIGAANDLLSACKLGEKFLTSLPKAKGKCQTENRAVFACALSDAIVKAGKD